MDGLDDVLRGTKGPCSHVTHHIRRYLDLEVGSVPGSDSACMFAFGQSCVSAELVSCHADHHSSVPIPVYSDSRVPGWVGEGTVVIIISYTGEETEVRTIIDEMSSRGCRLFCITSDESLARFCEGCCCDVFMLPSGMDPEEATYCEIPILCNIVQSAGFSDASDRLHGLLDELERFEESISGSQVVSDIKAHLEGSIPAVYGTSDVRAACLRWKVNLDSRGVVAFHGELPEFDHNELVGWFDPNLHAPELRIIVLNGPTTSGLLDFIVGSMVDILENEGRPVMYIDLGEKADPLYKNLRGMILADVAVGSRGRWI